MRRRLFCGTALALSLTSSPLFAASTLIKKVTIPSAARSGIAGFSTAIGSSRSFLGAPAGTSQPGMGYLMTTASSVVPRTLEPSAQRIDSLFGFDADLFGEDLLVGDPANPTAKIRIAGSAYLFDTATGNELIRLRPEDSFAGNEFGYSVSVWDKYAVIGSPQLGVGTGAAYLFDLTTGKQLLKLMAEDALEGSSFGSSVAVNDDYVLVGAPMNPDVLGYVPGAVYVYSRSTGEQLYKLQSPEGIEGDEFGFDLALQGNLALIGAPFGGEGYGTAHLFDLAVGKRKSRLVPTDNKVGNDFGASVDLWGDKALVGASGLGAMKGAVYVFDVHKGTQKEKISPTEVEASDSFALSFSVFENQLLIGSPRDDDTATNAGAGYLYDLEPLALEGDFDRDGKLDADDINSLTIAVRSGYDQPHFDVTGDMKALGSDRVIWVERVANTYFGDANLDGLFDTLDILQIFQRATYEDAIVQNGRWENGDWNGDGEFDSSDIILAAVSGGYNAGPRKPPEPTPEPTGATIWGLLIVLKLRHVPGRRN